MFFLAHRMLKNMLQIHIWYQIVLYTPRTFSDTWQAVSKVYPVGDQQQPSAGEQCCMPLQVHRAIYEQKLLQCEGFFSEQLKTEYYIICLKTNPNMSSLNWEKLLANKDGKNKILWYLNII